jgi:hypothetical protein
LVSIDVLFLDEEEFVEEKFELKVHEDEEINIYKISTLLQ